MSYTPFNQNAGPGSRSPSASLPSFGHPTPPPPTTAPATTTFFKHPSRPQQHHFTHNNNNNTPFRPRSPNPNVPSGFAPPPVTRSFTHRPSTPLRPSSPIGEMAHHDNRKRTPSPQNMGPSAASSPVQWGERPSSPNFGDHPSKKRYTAFGSRDDGGGGNGPSGGVGSAFKYIRPEMSRAPPVQYNDGFMNTGTNVMIRPTLSPPKSRSGADSFQVSGFQYNSQRSSPPISRPPPVQYNDDFLNTGANANSMPRPTLSPPKSRNATINNFQAPGFQYNIQRSSPAQTSQSPPVQYDDEFLNTGDNAMPRPTLSPPGFQYNIQRPPPSQTSRPPPVQYNDDFFNPVANAMPRSTLSPPKRRTGTDNFQAPGLQYNIQRSSPSETSRPPPVQYNDEFLSTGSNPMPGPAVSPPKSRAGTEKSQAPGFQRSSPSANGTIKSDSYLAKPSAVSPSIQKRNRSPPGHILQTSSNLAEDNNDEQELQARAKRFARFKTELEAVEPSKPVPLDTNPAAKTRIPALKSHLSAVEKQQPRGNHPPGMPEKSTQGLDDEDLHSSGSLIVGLCPDMCPESERAERERKGDLDQLERLDGDRNQTTQALAVKKYNRAAEREAELIRPMPVLQKTMEYLLGLLDQPYNARFLGLYNFLWDRMRAIRMDLRMQHIFDFGAITMLEQMIRLHILAMHELCEFPRGEGFTEGFDAHLNIEQMNKASVELFQMYDDHRKRGILIPTEKEFRGYYALLKLDKHPGYTVEPAELSLDLAQMTVEIRQTQEVLFAREVARSCRTGNFIAFFRHARKASYLQACLMHAHFSKLRTQALASLHSGLQSGQGIPVAHVAKWLGLEGEDIESLLEYHGFVIKEFEEPYVVKEGPFLNTENDYTTKCSDLVHHKKSNTIAEDVLYAHRVISAPSESIKELQSDQKTPKRPAVQPIRVESPLVDCGGAMDIESVVSPAPAEGIRSGIKTQKSTQVQSALQTSPRKSGLLAPASPWKSDIELPKAFEVSQSYQIQAQPSPATPRDNLLIRDEGQFSHRTPQASTVSGSLSFSGWTGEPISNELVGSVPPPSSVISEFEANQPEIVSSPPESSVVCRFVGEETSKDLTYMQQNMENDNVSCYDEEVAEAKLKLLLRLWRRRAVKKRELREQNRVAAEAALSSLSLGPPIRQSSDKLTLHKRFNIDEVVNERYVKSQRSWARWNVAELVAGKLRERNANSNCICWKVVSFSWSQRGAGIEARDPVAVSSLDHWLRYKLIPALEEEHVDDLVMSGPGLSIWRKWFANQSGSLACCFSVVKAVESCNIQKTLTGASAIVFPLSESVPWEQQRDQLHNLVMSLPTGACIPLLILSALTKDKLAEISNSWVDNLRLDYIDKSRVSTYAVISLNEREDLGHLNEYFSDEKLKEGLIWLASESRPQPILYGVTARELASAHLSSSLNAHALIGSNVVGPNQCISVFNKALDQSTSDIVTAANMNTACWPCPEVFLLDDCTAEVRAVKQFLPNLGWSSPEEVEPLVSTLRNCRLPLLTDDTSWLSRGCSTLEDIEEQRQLLQDCLIRYLSQSSKVMNLTMAMKEACVMLQKCTRLELLDMEYRLVPDWVLIFRRVFNWQMNNLACFNRKAYVLELSQPTSGMTTLENPEVEASAPQHSANLSLDELVEVSCSPIISKRIRTSPKGSQNVSVSSFANPTEGTTCIYSTKEKPQCSPIQASPAADSAECFETNNMQIVPDFRKGDDRLSEVLEQCRLLQNDIQEKLSLYF